MNCLRRSASKATIREVSSWSRTTRGVMTISRFVLPTTVARERNSMPRIGISPRIGIFDSFTLSFVCIRPPMMTGWRSRTTTTLSAERTAVTMPRFDVSTPKLPCETLETSTKIVSFSEEASLICGVIRRVMPTSSRLMVWVVVPAVPMVWPVGIGTFVATTIWACSLSDVSTLGVERTFTSLSLLAAFTMALYCGIVNRVGASLPSDGLGPLMSISLPMAAAVMPGPVSEVSGLVAPVVVPPAAACVEFRRPTPEETAVCCCRKIVPSLGPSPPPAQPTPKMFESVAFTSKMAAST